MPAGGAAIAAQVRRDDMEPSGRTGPITLRHEQAAREIRAAAEHTVGRAREAGLQDMDAQAVDIVHEAGADAGRQNRLSSGGNSVMRALRPSVPAWPFPASDVTVP